MDTPSSELRDCPACAEKVKAAALKCPYCGEPLSRPHSSGSSRVDGGVDVPLSTSSTAPLIAPIELRKRKPNPDASSSSRGAFSPDDYLQRHARVSSLRWILLTAGGLAFVVGVALLLVRRSNHSAERPHGVAASQVGDTQRLSGGVELLLPPGWRDIELTAGPRPLPWQCSREGESGSSSLTCKLCRKGGEPFSCATITSFGDDADPIISFDLDESWASRIDEVLVDLGSWLGKTTGSGHQLGQRYCWRKKDYMITLMRGLELRSNGRWYPVKPWMLMIDRDGEFGGSGLGCTDHDDADDAPSSRKSSRRPAAVEPSAAACEGGSTITVATRLRFGGLNSSSIRGCVYSVIGTVNATTADGWMIILGGSDARTAVALRSREDLPDGAFIHRRYARYIGFEKFDRTDGGVATLPAFELLPRDHPDATSKRGPNSVSTRPVEEFSIPAADPPPMAVPQPPQPPAATAPATPNGEPHQDEAPAKKDPIATPDW